MSGAGPRHSRPLGGPTRSTLGAGNCAPVESPCNNVCTLDEQTGWCLGCYRTLAEIGAWPSLDDAGKRALVERLAARRDAAGALRAAARDRR